MHLKIFFKEQESYFSALFKIVEECITYTLFNTKFYPQAAMTQYIVVSVPFTYNASAQFLPPPFDCGGP